MLSWSGRVEDATNVVYEQGVDLVLVVVGLPFGVEDMIS
jgi:hypothetical protein